MTASDSWATFDCYGTLADWLTGYRRAVEPFAGERAGELIDAYHLEEPGVQAEQPDMRYRDVLATALQRAAARIGLQLPAGEERALTDRWDGIPIFDDVGPELGELRAGGWRLALLSNCDDDLLARTAATIPVEIDLLVTAEQVGSYKPAHGHWRRFAELTEGRRGRWVHVAQSYFHDVVPTSELRLPCVWIDRTHGPEDPSLAAARLYDLGGLRATVERVTRAS